tara:strand:+ start:5248 stop:5448 length:201 start_codon:yes stop_codon:yes gene_type:complete
VEAFFIETTNEAIFTMATAHGNIEFLGTEFNIKTISDQVAVDVKNGLVQLKTKYKKGKVKKAIKAV